MHRFGGKKTPQSVEDVQCNGCMLYRLTTPRGHRSTPLVAGAVGTAIGRRPSSSSVRTISGVLLMMRNFALAPSIVFSALKSPFDFVRSSILSREAASRGGEVSEESE